MKQKTKGAVVSTFIIAFAAMFNAAMDELDHRFSNSFARNWNPKFWNPAISWMNKYIDGDPLKGRRKFLGIVIPVIFTDGWHAVKFFMILCICAVPVSFIAVEWWHWVLFIFCYGLVWCASFEIFYSKLFRNI